MHSFWLLLLPFVVYVYLTTGGVGLVRGDTTAIYNVSGGLLSMFVLALRNTWRLVVNVEQDEPHDDSKDSPNPTGQHGAARPGN